MSLKELVSIDSESFDIISVDLFDTFLLRDDSLQSERFMEASRLIAAALARRGRSVDARALGGLRSMLHQLAYRAVSIERPEGDAKLADMHAVQARLLGGGVELIGLFREAELAVERSRLSANRPLLALLERFAASGKRIVATSDTYYARRDLEWLIDAVVGANPIARVYASSDLGLTKHAGGVFAEVAAREGVKTARILHVGDDVRADVQMARAAGCRVVHLPRRPTIRRVRKACAALSRAARARTTGG